MSVKPSAAVGTTRTGNIYLLSVFTLTAEEPKSTYYLLYYSSTETSDTEITTTEIIKRRDVGPYGIRSEYCIRKIICPLGVPETPKGNADLRSNLLSRLLSTSFSSCHN